MILEHLRRVFEQAADREVFVGAHGSLRYGEWLAQVERVAIAPVQPGDVVALRVTATPECVATLWALLEQKAIVGLLGPADDLGRRAELLAADWIVASPGSFERAAPPAPRHALYRQLADAGRPGIVLLSSGTTGVPKAAVHDALRFFDKFAAPGLDLTTLLFLPLEHVGGLDTLFYALAHASCVVLTESRSVADVCGAIELRRVEVLPTNPSFLNLLLLSGAPARFDLSSLRIITFGAEVMPPSTLERLARAFPSVRLVQKYGSTEFGALRGRSRADGSLWLESSDQQQLRVVDGLLQIKTPAAMLGYLNADSPVSTDGWLATGDLVQQDGHYLRILGRASELINVGGDKVFPSEVEETLLQLPEVQDAVAYGEPNALLGQVVAVELVYTGPARGPELSALVRRHCAAKLAPHKVPMRVKAVPALSMGTHKKRRPRAGGPAGDAS